MTAISIEGGCTQVSLTGWRYDYTDSTGIYSVFFTAPQGVRPKIGDSIDGGVLVILTEEKSNQDKSKWIKHPAETWPEKPF